MLEARISLSHVPEEDEAQRPDAQPRTTSQICEALASNLLSSSRRAVQHNGTVVYAQLMVKARNIQKPMLINSLIL